MLFLGGGMITDMKDLKEKKKRPQGFEMGFDYIDRGRGSLCMRFWRK